MRKPVALLLCGFLASCAGSDRAWNMPGRDEVGESEHEETDGPDRALEWRRLRWLDEHKQIAPGSLQRAVAARQRLARNSTPTDGAGISSGTWTERGPSNVGGRTRALWIDPTTPSHLIAGSVGGGLWNTFDGGATWATSSDVLPTLAIGCIAGTPTNPDILYAGTGEGFFNGDALGGMGTYKSTNRGLTWALMPSTSGWDNVCRIAVSSTDPNVILVGKRYGGILRSTNGGTNWSNPHWAQGGYDINFHPTDGTKAVATVIDYDFGTNEWFHAAFYSNDAGATWTAATGLGRVVDFGSRIEVAYSRSSPTTVYAACGASGGLIWRSTDGGQSYIQQTTSGTTGSSWYAAPLWVDPTNPSFVISGGYHLFKSTNAGASLSQISNGYILTQQVHPDMHVVIEDPGYNGTTNRRVYATCDGGIFRTDNISTASTSSGWVTLSPGYRTSQFYGAAGHGPTGRILGGTQDNGTLRVTTAPGGTQAVLPFGGDGGFCAMDPIDPNYCYGEYVNLQIHRSIDGGMTSQGYIVNGLTDAGSNANFIAPFILDLNNPNTMWAGGRSLWRSTNVKAATPIWSAARPAGNDNISAIAVAKGNSNIVWIGLNNGEVYRTTNATAATPTWITVDDNGSTNPLPNRYITRIVIDPDVSSTAYVALGGFSDANLQKTTNGSTFTDITGSGATSLPLAPIYGVARHPTNAQWLYVGTEVGIFTSMDGGATWATTNEGPANVSVDEIVFMHGSTTLLAATHGRGLFTAPAKDCYADFDSNGALNANDFQQFLNTYSAGNSRANCDGTTTPPVLNANDFQCYLNAFASGCS